jgi:hypothetical protein
MHHALKVLVDALRIMPLAAIVLVGIMQVYVKPLRRWRRHLTRRR